MNNSEQVYDIAIVGGGVVGLATALSLARRGVKRLVVLEAEKKLATHQTGHNSGVIHSGLYYKPGSLKAKLCVEGRRALYEFCEQEGIRHERCGKLVVASSEEQLESLRVLAERGAANGLSGLRVLDSSEIGEYEPHVVGVAGLHVPETGIVDFTSVCDAYADVVRRLGHSIRLGARVVSVSPTASGFALYTKGKTVKCRGVICCCGLQSDRMAHLCGVTPGLKIVPFRGEYYELRASRRKLVKNLIYPVPDPQFPFLGVHFTRMVDGSVEAGPNAVLSFKREGYGRLSFSLRDAASTLTCRGFWRMARKHWLMGTGEMYRSWSKKAFVSALQRMIPELTPDDLFPVESGVRAQALEPDGALVDDFRIVERPGMIHVLNAPSPAATASLSIGKFVADRFEANC